MNEPTIEFLAELGIHRPAAHPFWSKVTVVADIYGQKHWVLPFSAGEALIKTPSGDEVSDRAWAWWNLSEALDLGQLEESPHTRCPFRDCVDPRHVVSEARAESQGVLRRVVWRQTGQTVQKYQDVRVTCENAQCLDPAHLSIQSEPEQTPRRALTPLVQWLIAGGWLEAGGSVHQRSKAAMSLVQSSVQTQLTMKENPLKKVAPKPKKVQTKDTAAIQAGEARRAEAALRYRTDADYRREVNQKLRLNKKASRQKQLERAAAA